MACLRAPAGCLPASRTQRCRTTTLLETPSHKAKPEAAWRGHSVAPRFWQPLRNERPEVTLPVDSRTALPYLRTETLVRSTRPWRRTDRRRMDFGTPHFR